MNQFAAVGVGILCGYSWLTLGGIPEILLVIAVAFVVAPILLRKAEKEKAA